jgi:hypothetical protein
MSDFLLKISRFFSLPRQPFSKVNVFNMKAVSKEIAWFQNFPCRFPRKSFPPGALFWF